MTRLMYDSVDPNAIPVNAEMVAGYVDGNFKWSDTGWSRFANSIKVRIAVFASTNDGDVLDVENGDASPDQAAGWIKMRQEAGIFVPTIYCNRSTRPAVEAACAGLTFDLWIATLDGTQDIAGTVAVQYAGSAITGQNYDLSIVTDDGWPHRTQPLKEKDNMGAQMIITPDPGGTPAPGPIPHIAHVDINGQLWVTYRTPDGWHPQEVVSSGLMPISSVDMSYDPFDKQLHIIVQTPDGHPVHCLTDAGGQPGGAWTVEHPGW